MAIFLRKLSTKITKLINENIFLEMIQKCKMTKTLIKIKSENIKYKNNSKY